MDSPRSPGLKPSQRYLKCALMAEVIEGHTRLPELG
jgi:hypothetical protein